MGDKKVTSSYEVTYSSYSGCDIIASITIPQFNTKPLVIGELQTISYSIHREVVPVRTLGRANPKGFTAGTRTIAGSLIFTVFDSNLVHKIAGLIREAYNERGIDYKKYSDRVDDIAQYAVMDEMPPFDVTISFMNEYGNHSILVIKGIVIVDEGQVMSIEDMITENTMSYMATDIQVLKSEGRASPRGAYGVIKGSDTALASLSVEGRNLNPPFDPATTEYYVRIPKDSEIPAVTAIPRDKNSTVKITPAPRVPGTARIIVTGEDNSTTTYKIAFVLSNDNAKLSGIKVGGAPIEDFDPNTTEYAVQLTQGIRSIPKVEGVPDDLRATVKVFRVFKIPDTATIEVTAPDGSTKKIYKVSLSYIPEDSDATLSSVTFSAGTLTPAFSPYVYDYTLTVQSNTVPAITAATSSTDASFFVSYGPTVPSTVTITCTSKDMSNTKTYNFNVVNE